MQLLWLAALLLAGCEAFIPVPAPPPKARPPFHYETLGVHNSCLVESIHFYDVFRQKMGEGSWIRVLDWGNAEGDFKISSGHAVAVYVADGELFGYDVNFGFWKLGVPVEKRGDLTEVAPAVERRYHKVDSQPVFERYREDWVVHVPEKAPSFIFYHKSKDVRDATRVASELGKFRDVRMAEFDFMENGVKQTSVAVAFVFDARLCVYFPRGGTHVSSQILRDVRDAATIKYVINRIYPTTLEIREDPRTYRLLPHRE